MHLSFLLTAVVALHTVLASCNFMSPGSPEGPPKVNKKDLPRTDSSKAEDQSAQTNDNSTQTSDEPAPKTTDVKLEDLAENALLLSGPQSLIVSEEASFSILPSDPLDTSPLTFTELTFAAEPSHLVNLTATTPKIKMIALSEGVVTITASGKANGRRFKFSKSLDIVLPSATEILVDTLRTIKVGSCSAVGIFARKGTASARFARPTDMTPSGTDFVFYSDSTCQTVTQKETLDGLSSKTFYLRTDKALTSSVRFQVSGLTTVDIPITASPDVADSAQNINLTTVAGSCLAVPLSLKDRFGNAVDVLTSGSTLDFQTHAAVISRGQDLDIFSDNACQQMATPDAFSSSRAKLNLDANSAPVFYVKARKSMSYHFNVALAGATYNVTFALYLEVRPGIPSIVRLILNDALFPGRAPALFTNQCSEIEVKVYDQFYNPSNVSADMTIPLTTAKGSLPTPNIALFKNAGCTEPSGRPVIGAGESSKRLYVGTQTPVPATGTFYNSYLFMALNDVRALGLAFESAIAPNQDLRTKVTVYERPDRLVVVPGAPAMIGSCQPYTVGPGLLVAGTSVGTLYDGDTSPIDVNLHLSNDLQVFSNSKCNTPVFSFSFSKWGYGKTVYIKVTAGETQLIADASNAWSASQTIVGVSGPVHSLKVTGPTQVKGPISYLGKCVGPYYARPQDFYFNEAAAPTTLTLTMGILGAQYFTDSLCSNSLTQSVMIPSGSLVSTQGVYKKLYYSGSLPATVPVVTFETSFNVGGGTLKTLSGTGTIKIVP